MGAAQVSESLIQSRHDAGLATLITTQLKPSHKDPAMNFGAKYGHHVLDRINSGGGRWFDLGAKSRRTDARPIIGGLVRACVVADLVSKVESLTGLAGVGHPQDIEALVRITNLSEDAIAEAVTAREAMAEQLRIGAAGLGDGAAAGLVGAILERLS